MYTTYVKVKTGNRLILKLKDEIQNIYLFSFLPVSTLFVSYVFRFFQRSLNEKKINHICGCFTVNTNLIT